MTDDNSNKEKGVQDVGDVGVKYKSLLDDM